MTPLTYKLPDNLNQEINALEETIERFRELAENDVDYEVRELAQEALDRWGK